MSTRCVLLMLVLAAGVEASEQRANPIRKVVTMLQNMQTKVTTEGEKQKDLFDKFMCYCKNGRGDLDTSISDAENKIANVDAAAKAASAKKVQTAADLAQHKTDRADAKDAITKATSIRQKQAADYTKESSDLTTNIAALGKATNAIEKGMTGFVQTSAAAVVRNLAMEKADISDDQRQELLSFLSGTYPQGGQNYQSGEIVGILKTMHDEMSTALSDADAAEASAIQNYKALMGAKGREIEALSAQVEEETTRVGELSVEIASMSNDLEDTQTALGEDKKFLSELNGGCDKKAAEWEEIKKTRAEELVALAETIKVLDDDDALDLFKKTLPSASASFVQIQSGARRAKALSLIKEAAKNSKSPQLDLIEMAINGKKIGFAKVITMIDEMVANLKVEQGDDDKKRDYCNTEFDATDDKKKGLEQSIADSETAIEELEGAIATLKEEIAALVAGIKALDASVADATSQRKAEHADYTELMANDGAAKDVLAWAKNRLNQFYNPKMYVAPAKRDLSEEDRITVNMGGTLAPTAPPGGIAHTGIVGAFEQGRAAPGSPPATFGAYKNSNGGGVIAMIDVLVKDLDKEMTESDTAEKDSQADYEKLMGDSADKRAQDAKSVTDKNANKANAEESLQAEQDNKGSTQKELTTTLEVIHGLHGECDWLLKYFDARKAARAGEVEALENAKAVLNGADYSLIQVHEQTCPSTSVQCGLSKDAAGDIVFVPHDLPSPGECVNVGSEMPKDGEFKICGPGTFTLSRMTCERHDYKAVTITHATDAYTATDCKTYKLADYYEIHGYIGSASYTCGETAR